MSTSEYKDLISMRSHAMELFNASIESVDPYEAVRKFISLDGDRMILGRDNNKSSITLNLNDYDSIFLVGGGKATAPMARAIEELLGDRLKAGIINVKYGFTEKLSITEIIEADHPIPDQNGVGGTTRILDLLQNAGEKDLVFSLISGGGSALLPQPAGGISLEEKQSVTRNLLKCGAGVDEINVIRKHISAAKGGQMARAAYPATIINFMLSDVVGDRMDVIASGPFVPDKSTFKESLQIIEKYRLDDIPPSVRDYLEAGDINPYAQIDISHVTKGIYIVLLTVDDKMYTQRVVIN